MLFPAPSYLSPLHTAHKALALLTEEDLCFSLTSHCHQKSSIFPEMLPTPPPSVTYLSLLNPLLMVACTSAPSLLNCWLGSRGTMTLTWFLPGRLHSCPTQ